MRPQNARDLLLSISAAQRCRVEINGREWICDMFGAARVEVFRKPPATKLERLPLAKVLNHARRQPRLGRPYDSLFRASSDGEELVLLRITGVILYMSFRKSLWDAWSATGLEPEVRGGRLLWYETVRSKRRLMGVTMPCAAEKLSAVKA